VQSTRRGSARPTLGAVPVPEGTRFCVWAPAARRVEVVFADRAPEVCALSSAPDGYFSATARGIGAGARYWYRLDGERLLPDPASRFQPEGVHGPSEVIDPGGFEWTDADWPGVSRESLVIYELHIGTFSEAGTFEGARQRLPHVAALGATAVEIMPVGDFPGHRNWGYDGVDLFSPSRAYGRPDDLRRLIDSAHRAGLAVLIDAVYNHLGPEGAYLGAFASQYFSQRHHTPWGAAINLDGPGSREVRRFLVENAWHWLREYHADGLRLDATHALIDESTPHFLRELADRVRAFRPDALLIAEDERKLPDLTAPPNAGGWGLDAIWSDDFHHHVRRLLAGDHEGYYAPYTGSTADIALTIDRGWWTAKSRGADGVRARVDPDQRRARSQYVFCLQNHDQVGNRAFGGRLHHEIELAPFAAATVLLLLAPETPLLFMGQEWAASTPFLYFTDLPEPLGQMVTSGRRAEFGAFTAFADAASRERIPDPQAPGTFEASRLRWEERNQEPHASMLRLHRRLLELRRAHPAMRRPGTAGFDVRAIDDDALALRWRAGDACLIVAIRLRGTGAVCLPPDLTSVPGKLGVLLTTEDPELMPSPAPVAVHLAESVTVDFSRPGAIVLGTGVAVVLHSE
jgi:maltooligosyltrehalose trehalohydrolase